MVSGASEPKRDAYSTDGSKGSVGVDFKVHQFKGYAELPERYAPLLEQASGKGFFHSQPWFEFLMKYYWDDSELFLYAVEDATGRPLLLVPLQLNKFDGAVPSANTIASVGHMENFSVMCLLFNPALDEQRLPVLTTLFRTLKSQSSPTIDVLRLWPVATGSELDKLVGKALKNARYSVQRYANSFNRFEDTAGLGFDEYFAKRNSKYRYNVRTRERNLEKEGNLETNIYTGDNSPEDLQRGTDEYTLGTVESWQSSASLASRHMMILIRLAAREGCLRLGVLKLDGRPIAGQFWLVSGGSAHCMRQAYHEDYKKLAPGIVLTKHMLAHVLDEDHVDAIDFGMGTEDYKEKWMSESRDYSGFMAFDRGTPRGLAFAIQHIIGRPVKRLLARAVRSVLRRLLKR